MQISLLSCVTPNLRQVNVILHVGKIVLNFYYAQITPDEEEFPDDIEAEMWSFYDREAVIEKNVFTTNHATLPQAGLCVYRRYEDNGNSHDLQMSGKPIHEENRHLVMSYVTQVSLLGYVTPNLRAVKIIEDKEAVKLNFYYNSIDEKERDFPYVVSNKVKYLLENKKIIANTIILPFPSRLPEEGLTVYARYEKQDSCEI